MRNAHTIWWLEEGELENLPAEPGETRVWSTNAANTSKQVSRTQQMLERKEVHTVIMITRDEKSHLGKDDATLLLTFGPESITSSPCKLWTRQERWKKKNKDPVYVVIFGQMNIREAHSRVWEDVHVTLEKWEKESAVVNWPAWEKCLTNLKSKKPATLADWVTKKTKIILKTRREGRFFYGKWDEPLKDMLVGSGLSKRGWKDTRMGITKAVLEAI
jgi:hypothetical protein